MTWENSINGQSSAEPDAQAASMRLFTDSIDNELAPKASNSADELLKHLFHQGDANKFAKQSPFNIIDCLRSLNSDSDGESRSNDPWWKDRHDGLVKRAHEGNIDMLFLGDSITDWMNVDLLHKKFGDEAVNFGIAGDRVEHLQWRMRNGELDIPGKNPELVVVLIGTNNLGTSTNENIEHRVELNLEEIRRKLPDSKILLLGILPRDEMPDTPFRKRIKEINNEYKNLADNNHIFFADIGKDFLEPDGKISPTIMSDFLHPTKDAGYERMFNAIKPYADKILSK